MKDRWNELEDFLDKVVKEHFVLVFVGISPLFAFGLGIGKGRVVIFIN